MALRPTRPPSSREHLSSRAAHEIIVGVLVALAVFFLAYDRGTYALPARHLLAVVVWWTLFLFVGLRVWPSRRLGTPWALTASAFAAFVLYIGASAIWAPSAERAIHEFDRALLYFGVFAVAALAGTETSTRAWSDGIAAGIASIGVIAFGSRFVLDADEAIRSLLPNAATRLTYPVGYWNGLAIFVALAVPLLLSASLVRDHWWSRALAVAPFPVIICVIYLASSRGGMVVAASGAATFVLFASRRWAALAVTAVGSGSAVAAIVVLRASPASVAPVGGAAAEARGSAVAVMAIAALSGCVWGIASTHVTPPRISPTVGKATAAVAALVFAAAVVAVDPVERAQAFRAPPSLEPVSRDGFVQDHLASGGGSGRWQFWQASLEQFADEPLHGEGAGTFEARWAQHGSLELFVRDAHSLYFETLGELGLIGFALLGLLLAAAVAAIAHSLRRSVGDQRLTAAGIAAALVAYLIGAGIDWMWELTAVTVVGMLMLGLLVRPAAGSNGAPPSRLVSTAAAIVACLAIAAQAIPLLSSAKLSASRDAAARGDAADALVAAAEARNIEPWSAAPYLQLALVEEEFGDLERARGHIADAKAQDPRDWRLWLVSARIETKLGSVRRARTELARARELNPRSPLLSPRS